MVGVTVVGVVDVCVLTEVLDSVRVVGVDTLVVDSVLVLKLLTLVVLGAGEKPQYSFDCHGWLSHHVLSIA